MPEGGLALALLRGLSGGGCLAAFGVLLFGAVVLPRALAGADLACSRQRLRPLAGGLLGFASLAGLAWLLAETMRLTGAESLGQGLAVLPLVGMGTHLGQVALLRLVLLAATALALRLGVGWGWLALAGGGASGLLAGHGHAWAMTEAAAGLRLVAVLHLLAAGAWLGALPALALLVRTAPPRQAAALARWFSPLGKLSVAVLLGAALVQGWVMLGSLGGLFGTPYGLMLLVKLVLLAALLGFAWANRYRLAPALRGAEPAQAQRRLLLSLRLQALCGLAVLLAAGVLAGLPAAMHEQPLWPFPWRPSLKLFAEPELAWELGWALAATAAGGAALGLGLAWRRGRWPALLAGLALLWLGAPSLGLLLVPAWPTSYYRSPTGFAASGIVAGAGLYQRHCASCHGAQGRGDGPAAAGLAVPPADLTADHLWDHPDGELFWWLTAGMTGPRGEPVMPGFAPQLAEEERWALIDFLRARNAGLARRETGQWPRPVPLPGFTALCDGRPVAAPEAWAGQVVRITLGPSAASPEPVPGLLEMHQGAPAAAGCTSADAALGPALALLIGGEAPPGSAFLVDASGMLGGLQLAGQPGDRQDAAELRALVARLAQARPGAGSGGAHHHGH